MRRDDGHRPRCAQRPRRAGAATAVTDAAKHELAAQGSWKHGQDYQAPISLREPIDPDTLRFPGLAALDAWVDSKFAAAGVKQQAVDRSRRSSLFDDWHLSCSSEGGLRWRLGSPDGRARHLVEHTGYHGSTGA